MNSGPFYPEHKCTLLVSSPIAQAPYTEDLPPTAKPCQRLVRLFQSSLLVSPYHRGTILYIGSELGFINERRRQINAKHWFMIHPYSLFILFWQMFILSLWIIDSILIPYSIFFHSYERTQMAKFVFTCDIFACLNIVIRFLTAFYNPVTKEIIFDLSKAANNYLKNDFIFDLIGSLPLQILVMPLKKKSLRETMYFFKIFRSKCLLAYLEQMFFQFEINLKAQYKIGIILKSIIYVQFTTALYYQFGKTVYFLHGEIIPKKLWIVREEMHQSNSTVLSRYWTALFFVTGFVTSSGESNNYPGSIEETMMVVLIMCTGYIFLTYLIITVYCYNIYTRNEELQYNAKLSELESYFRKKGIPPTIQNRAFTYTNYKWEGKYFDEEKIMKTISRKIQMEIKLHECEKLLYMVPFIKNIPKKLFMDLIEYLHLEIYLPGRIIIEAGTIGRTMYLVKCGCISIRDSNGKEVRSLHDGSYFGEACLIHKDNLCNESAVTMEISELYHLKQKDWQRCLTFYPQVQQMFSEDDSEKPD